MNVDIFEEMFSERGLVIDGESHRTERLYSVTDTNGLVLATEVSMDEARRIAAANDMFGYAGPYQYIETYTRWRGDTVLFSGENTETFSHDASHVSSHVE